MSSEKFCLRWNDFESNISSAFRELREDKDFFDVTLACDDEQLQAHKVILSACSPFFRTVLRRNRHEHPLLYLKGVKYADLVSVLNFMYHGEVNVAQEELNSFLAVAEDLKVKGLTQNNSGSSSKPPPAPSHRPSHSPPPPKRPRPLPPAAPAPRPNTSSYHHRTEEDDEIQEVAAPAAVKEEPRTLHQAAAHAQEDTSGGQMEQYEGEEQYGEYEGYEGEYDTGAMGDGAMVGGDGNKELDSVLERLIIKGDDGSFICTTCGKAMARKKDMKRHVEVHMDGFHQCHLCQKVSKTRSGLATHISTYHKDMVASPWSMKPN